MDNLKQDRFELLSAYLDGEVTPEQREQVLAWLEHDQNMQCLYARLLKLRRGLQGMPVPQPTQSIDNILAKVEANTRPRRRRAATMWGGMAIAALFVSAIMGSLTVPGAINQVETAEESKTDLTDQTAVETVEDIEGAEDKAIDATGAAPASSAPTDESISPDALMITIDEPVVPIPLAGESAGEVRSADADGTATETMPEVEAPSPESGVEASELL